MKGGEPERVEVYQCLGPPLKAVGYWCALLGHPGYVENDNWPDPRQQVAPDWRPDDRARIVAYLRAGHPFQRYRGCSYCRFTCGVDYLEMGSQTFTDGEWAWPEGLAHYIESHAVRLPEAFVESMQQRSWIVPVMVLRGSLLRSAESKQREAVADRSVMELPDGMLTREDFGDWLRWAATQVAKQA